MKRLLITAAAVVLVFASVSAGAVSGQTPRITGVYTSTFEGVQPPMRYFTLLQGISEFLPGEAARQNFTSMGPRYFTAIEGQVTVTIGDKTTVFKAGEKWNVPQGILFAISNQGTTRARVFFTGLSPAGDTIQPAPGSVAPAAPSRILWIARTDVYVPAPRINLVQVIQDWDAGAKNTPHTMNHPHLYIVVEGENTVHYLDGVSDRYTVGQQGIMQVGRAGIMENQGAIKGRLAITWLVTPGTPFTSPVSTGAAVAGTTGISPPSAGDAGLGDGAPWDDRAILASLLGGAAVGLLVLAVARRRFSSR